MVSKTARTLDTLRIQLWGGSLNISRPELNCQHNLFRTYMNDWGGTWIVSQHWYQHWYNVYAKSNSRWTSYTKKPILEASPMGRSFCPFDGRCASHFPNQRCSSSLTRVCNYNSCNGGTTHFKLYAHGLRLVIFTLFVIASIFYICQDYLNASETNLTEFSENHIRLVDTQI